ncbi:MAG: folylpolyglutamate synthase/dihydrofolate synthase family protein [Anaerolineales bacterium]
MSDPETAYQQALDYLYSFVDYSLKHASELARADFNLDRMEQLMHLLGDPHRAYPVLHVAGTKGKGSVCALSAAALQAAGLRVGLYTSPHLLDYAERIQINATPIPHAHLAELVETLKPFIAQVPYLTTFEITTGLAFLYFAQQKVDIAVIEVGLGGRLDATNIVWPQVSVITSISYDHMAVLGNTLAQIAGEKAGIIKEGRPVVSASQAPEALEVIEKVAKEKRAPLTLLTRDVFAERSEFSLKGQAVRIWTRDGRRLETHLPLLGSHQVENAGVAAAALWKLQEQGIPISDQAIREGFAAARWPARFEIVRTEPPVIFDSAHNQASFRALSQTLAETFPQHAVYLVFGSSEDKDIPAMLGEIRPRLKKLILTRARHPRAAALTELEEIARAQGIAFETHPEVAQAFARALELASQDGNAVLVAGSMFVTAEAMEVWPALASNSPSAPPPGKAGG